MSKKNLQQLALEISKSWKKRDSRTKGKGKSRFILQEESDDEDELLARATDILEDAA